MNYTTCYPPSFDSNRVKTTTYSGGNGYKNINGQYVSWELYHGYLACDPSVPLVSQTVYVEVMSGFYIPTPSFIGWLSESGTVTNRFNVDLGSRQKIERICLENYSFWERYTEIGIYEATLQGSNSASSLAQTNYSSNTYWTDIDEIEFDQHVAINQKDIKYYEIDNNNKYRYYSLKIHSNQGSEYYSGIKHIEFQRKHGKRYLKHPNTELFGVSL